MPNVPRFTNLLLVFAIGVLLPIACCCAEGVDASPGPQGVEAAIHGCCEAAGEPVVPVPAAPEHDCGCEGEFLAVPSSEVETLVPAGPVASVLFPDALMPAFLASICEPVLHHFGGVLDAIRPPAPTLRALNILLTV